MRDQSSLLFQWSTAFDTFHKIFKSDWQRHGAVVCMLLLAVIITETAPLHQVRSHTHTHTHTHVAIHIAFILSYFDSKQTILHWIILSTQLNPTQPNHRVWYEAVQNHYKWRRHASELSPAGSWLYRLCTHHLSFIIHSFGNLLSRVSKWVVVLLCL